MCMLLRRNLVQQADGNRGIHLLKSSGPHHEVVSEANAGIAQLVEQLICNQQVVGSNPTAGSPNFGFWISDCGLVKRRQSRKGSFSFRFAGRAPDVFPI